LASPVAFTAAIVVGIVEGESATKATNPWTGELTLPLAEKVSKLNDESVHKPVYRFPTAAMLGLAANVISCP